MTRDDRPPRRDDQPRKRDDRLTTAGVRDALASHFDDHGVARRLHAVPPHEVYEVRVDGRRAVYKGDVGPTGSAGTEGRVVALVGERTAVPVPEVLAVGDDHFVAAWHPDAPAPDDGGTTDDEESGADGPPADEQWARAAGRGLARLHEETGPLLDGYGVFQPRDDDSAGREDGASRDADGVTEDLAVAGHDDWHAAALAYVRRHRATLARHGHADVADAVRDALADRPDAFDGAGGPVCCHGWATPEHVAVADGRVACLVDFEHAIAAPGEFDYWRTVGPAFGPADGDRGAGDGDCGEDDAYEEDADCGEDGDAYEEAGDCGEDDADRDDAVAGDGARRAFRAGYESVRSLPDGFERRRPLYAALNGVYYFESLYVQDRHGPAETEARAAALRERVLEVVADLS